MNIIDAFERKKNELDILNNSLANFKSNYGKIILNTLGFNLTTDYSKCNIDDNYIFVYHLNIKNKKGDIELNCDYFKLIFRVDNENNDFHFEVSLRNIQQFSKESFKKHMSKYLILNNNIDNLDYLTLKSISDKYFEISDKVKLLEKDIERIKYDYFKEKNQCNFNKINNLFPVIKKEITLQNLINNKTTSFITLSLEEEKVIFKKNRIDYNLKNGRSSFTLNFERISKSNAIKLVNSQVLFKNTYIEKFEDIPFIQIENDKKHFNEFDFPLNEFLNIITPLSSIQEF